MDLVAVVHGSWGGGDTCETAAFVAVVHGRWWRWWYMVDGGWNGGGVW